MPILMGSSQLTGIHTFILTPATTPPTPLSRTILQPTTQQIIPHHPAPFLRTSITRLILLLPQELGHIRKTIMLTRVIRTIAVIQRM